MAYSYINANRLHSLLLWFTYFTGLINEIVWCKKLLVETVNSRALEYLQGGKQSFDQLQIGKDVCNLQSWLNRNDAPPPPQALELIR